MRYFVIVLCFVFFGKTRAQIGIGTTTPSVSSALEVNSLRNTTSVGGFLMPVVTEAQQNAIPVATLGDSDDGLMVFVSDVTTGKHCWEIYDGVSHVWRSIYCAPCNGRILFSEDFESYTTDSGITGSSAINGDYPSGVTKWSLSSYSTARDGSLAYPGTLLDADDYALVKNGALEIQDVNGPLLFETQPISISGISDVLISLDISESGILEYLTSDHTDDFDCGTESSGNDYVDILYSTDGGVTFTEVTNFSGMGTTDHTFANNLSGVINFVESGINGTSLVIQIRFQNWASDERYFIDNITVSCN